MLECLPREGSESQSVCKCVCYVFFYGKLTMPGVITSSDQNVSLHTDPDVWFTNGYVFTISDHTLYTSCMSSYPV